MQTLLSHFRVQSRNWSATHKRIVGVEIGVDMVRFVLLESNPGGRHRILNFHGEPLDRSFPMDSPEFAMVVRRGFEITVGSHRGVKVWAGLPRDRVRAHHLTLPRISPNQLTRAVFWALQHEEAFNKNEMLIDYHVEEEVRGENHPKLAITAHLVPKEDRDLLAGLFLKAGCPLHGIALPLHSMRNFSRSGWTSDPTAPVVHSYIGGRNARICILDGNRTILTRGIPIGVDLLAEEVATSLPGVGNETDALRLIMKLGRSGAWEAGPDPEQVFAIIRPALERVAKQIDRTLEYYRTQFRDRDPIQCVQLGGPITQSPRCRDFIRDQISAPLEVIDPFSAEEVRNEPVVPKDVSERHAFATAFGLALASDSYCPNFLHTFEDRRLNARYRRVNAAIFTTFLLCAFALTGYFWIQRSTIAELRETHSGLEARMQSEQREVIDSDVLLGQMSGLKAERERILTSLNHYRALAVLTEFAELTPDSVNLESFSVYMGRPDSLRPIGSTSNSSGEVPWLRASGALYAAVELLDVTLSLHMRDLEASPLFESVVLRHSERSRNVAEGRLRFDLEVTLGEFAMEEP